jgi:sRNA-binding protein
MITGLKMMTIILILTIKLNKKMNKKIDVNIIKELYTILNKSYPILDINNRKPLAIGTHHELRQQTGLPNYLLRKFMAWYCNFKYRKLIVKGAERYNLKGEVVGTVTEEEDKYSKKVLIETAKNNRTVKDQKNILNNDK